MPCKLRSALIALLLASCQGSALSDASFLPTNTPFPTDFEAIYQVGDYQMMLTCQGTGEPTILLENGLSFASWSSVDLRRFSRISRTCTYLRPGMSGESVKGNRSAGEQADELNALLQQSEVPGPYILVGHSYGGWIALLYADRYPSEVAGLVCVACLPPKFDSLYRQNLTSALSDTYEKVNTVLINPRWGGGGVMGDAFAYLSTRESIDMCHSNSQVLSVTSLGGLPLIVLVEDANPDFSDGDVQADQILWDTLRYTSNQLAALSARARVEIVKTSNRATILAFAEVDRAVEEVFQNSQNYTPPRRIILSNSGIISWQN